MRLEFTGFFQLGKSGFKIKGLGVSPALVVSNVGSESVKKGDKKVEREDGKEKKEIGENRRDIKGKVFV